MKAMSKAYKDVGDNAAALVRLTGQGWNKNALILNKAVKNGVDGAAALAKTMQEWRITYMTETMPKKMGWGVKAVRTGKPELISDLDMSFIGKNASSHRRAAIRHMEENFGHDWRELLDADIFTDPKRLNLLETIGEVSTSFEKRVAKETELNYLARKIRATKGLTGDELKAANAEIKKFANSIGVEMESVTKRVAELDELAAPIERLKKAQKEVSKLSEEFNDATKGELKKSIKDSLDAAKQEYHAARESLYKSHYSKLELQQDVLHKEFLSTTSVARKREIAEEMHAIQSKLNAANEGAYFGGGATEHAIRREHKIREPLKKYGYKSMEFHQLYSRVFDDLNAFETAMQEIKKDGLNEKTAKSLVKYANRLEISATYLGIDTAKSVSARELFDKVSDLLAVARSDPKRLVKSEIIGHVKDSSGVLIPIMSKVPDHLKDAITALKGQLDLIKSSLPEIKASLPQSIGKIETIIAHQETLLKSLTDELVTWERTVRWTGRTIREEGRLHEDKQ